MRRIRHPDGRQLARPVQLCQHKRIAAVRLNPIPRFDRNQRGRDHNTVMPHLDKVPVKTIAAGPSLIAEVKPSSACRQLLHQLTDLIWTVWHGYPVPNFIATRALGNANGYRCLMDVQPDKRAMFHPVSPPFLRIGASQSGATLEQRMPRERPPT